MPCCLEWDRRDAMLAADEMYCRGREGLVLGEQCGYVVFP